MYVNLKFSITTLIILFLTVSHLVKAQTFNSENNTANTNGSQPNTEGKPVQYQQPYPYYYPGLPLQQPYPELYQQYPVPVNNFQTIYPVFPNNPPHQNGPPNGMNGQQGGALPLNNFYPNFPNNPLHQNGPHNGNNGLPLNNFYPGFPNNPPQRNGPNNGNNGQQGGGLPEQFYPGLDRKFQLGTAGEGYDPYPHIAAEIVDVDPEYQRKLLGPINNDLGAPSNVYQNNNGPDQRYVHHRKPTHYIVKTSGSTSNHTSIPQQMNKPLITKNSYSTTIRRSFVNDPSNPQKPINLHFVNGVQVNTERTVNDEQVEVETSETTTAVTQEDVQTTTENENPQENRSSLQGRRFLDVPKTCPTGTRIAHNGQCLETFKLSISFPNNQNNNQVTTTTDETTTASNDETETE